MSEKKGYLVLLVKWMHSHCQTQSHFTLERFKTAILPFAFQTFKLHWGLLLIAESGHYLYTYMSQIRTS